MLARIAPLFGSREIFLAALLGLILVIIAHRGKTLVAGMLACFGIFLSTVGLEPVKYTSCYTFDQSWLANGIDLIVVVLGLFAVSQSYFLMSGDDTKIRVNKVRGNLFQGFKELGRHPVITAISGLYGVVMGIIPGVGEFTAQFMSYTTAQRISKRPQAFGHGSSEGLIASETANNAVPGAAMIPLLALGIPGEALTAMMLSVFYVHNVIPGPGLFLYQLDFVTGLYLALFILNVVVVVFLMFSTNFLVQLVRIPNRFLGVCILTLGFVGVYSLRNNPSDCLMAAVFGLIGYVLRRLKLPIIPIILGMVLGGIMEVKFRSAMSRVKEPLDFIERPIAGIIFAIIVLVLVIHFIRIIKDWQPRKERRWTYRKASTKFGTILFNRRNYLLQERGKKLRETQLTSFHRLMGKRLTTLASAAQNDVDKSVAAARESFEKGTWARMPPRGKQRILHKIADLIEANSLELAVLGGAGQWNRDRHGTQR